MQAARLWLVLVLVAFTSGAFAAPAVIHYRDAAGKWLPLPCQQDVAAGTVSFVLDPKVIGAGATTVILGDTRGLVLDDEQAPRLTGLKLDGRAVKIAPVTNLDWLPAHPQVIRIGVSDAANPLDLATMKLEVYGKALTAGQYQIERVRGSKRTVTLVLPVGQQLAAAGQFQNRLQMRISDLSPQHNTTSLSLSYCCLGEITGDPMILPESSYVGYEDLKVLSDGKLMKPGETTYGSTWAAEEVPGDHWLVYAWPSARTLSKVEVSWATYGGTYHAPQKLLVQTWDGRQWVTQRELRDLKAEPTTVIEFAPVRTTRLRLMQPDGMGNPVRPNIMWITEIALDARP